MKTLSFVGAFAVLGFAVGCQPAAPALGTQIDRMGRPAINTAVSDPFDTVTGKSVDEAKDAYNAVATPSDWAGTFSGDFQKSLAILDALDQNCGNQLVAKAATGGTVPADRYATLGGVLADDQLYVNTASSTCSLYLAVEADYTGLAPNNGDCGGRTPLEDVADESYSLLATGQPSGVTDGVDSDGDGPPSITAFPFLRAPN